MKGLILFVCVLVFTLTACEKSSVCDPVTTTAPAAEIAVLQNYLDTSGLTATKDSRGFFYSISAAGSDSKPGICNDVTVKYLGKLINGTKFDENTTGITFPLTNLITGWKAGIPLIGKGGKIKLYLPPTLAYGSAGSGTSIPPNSSLVFEIELVNFN